MSKLQWCEAKTNKPGLWCEVLPVLRSFMASSNLRVQYLATRIVDMICVEEQIPLFVSHGCVLSFLEVLPSSDIDTVAHGLDGLASVSTTFFRC